MEKINIIMPILNKNTSLNEVNEQIKMLVAGYEEDYEFEKYFILRKEIETKEAFKNEEHSFVIETQGSSFNELVKEGFTQIGAEKTILLNVLEEEYKPIFHKIMAKIKSNNIVLVKKMFGKKSQFKLFFRNFFVKLYYRYLRFLGLDEDLLCSNYFQYFNKDVVTLFKALPEKSSYVRNFKSTTGYTIEIVEQEVKKENRESFINKKDYGVILAMVGISFSFLIFVGTLIFTNFILALNSGIGYYFMLFGFSVFTSLLSGYLLVKKTLKLRANI